MTQRMTNVIYFFHVLNYPTVSYFRSVSYRDHVEFPSVVDNSSCENGYENIERNSIDPKVFCLGVRENLHVLTLIMFLQTI